jgi:hypothetical protein
MQLLLDFRLREMSSPTLCQESLQAVLDEIGKNTAARGLTPAALESMLNDGRLAWRLRRLADDYASQQPAAAYGDHPGSFGYGSPGRVT